MTAKAQTPAQEPYFTIASPTQIVPRYKGSRFSLPDTFGDGSYYSRAYNIGDKMFWRERSTVTLRETNTNDRNARPLSLGEFDDWCDYLDLKLQYTLSKIKL